MLHLCYHLDMDYSKLIKTIRDILLLSQSELADLLGVSYASVNRWENKHCSPTIKVKRKIKGICKENKIPFGREGN